MREVTPDAEVSGAKEYLEHGVFDKLIAACLAEAPICAVHERLKRAYIERITAIKEAIENGNLPRTKAKEMQEIGKWVFKDRTLKGKEALADELGDLMSNTLVWTQVKRVLAEATRGHQGPESQISMTRADLLMAWQMYEDGAKWQDVADKFEPGQEGNLDRMHKRMRPLRSVVKKYCPLKKRKQILP